MAKALSICSGLVVTSVFFCLVVLGSQPAHADEGHWELQPARFPQGKTLKKSTMRAVLKDTSAQMNERVTYLPPSGGRTLVGEYRWTTSWVVPPKILTAREKFTVLGRVHVQRFRAEWATTGILRIWGEGRGVGQARSDELRLKANESVTHRDRTWGFQAPAEGRKGAEFSIVVGAVVFFGQPSLTAVYTYRWVTDGPKLEVRARLEDDDHQFTIADEARLHLRVDNRSTTAFEDVTIECDVAGALGDVDEPTLYFPEADDKPSFRASVPGGLPARSAYRLEVLLRSAGSIARKNFPAFGGTYDITPKTRGEDRKLWLNKTLILHPPTDDAVPVPKPKPERSHELEHVLRIKVRGRAVGAPKASLLYSRLVSIGDALRSPGNPKGIVRLSYPDFRPRVPPTASVEQLRYYANGDPVREGGLVVIRDAVRAIALRAARFGRPDSLTVEMGSDEPRLPEDPAQVVENVAWYVFHALRPRQTPAYYHGPETHAEALLKGEYGFGVKPKVKGPPGSSKTFVCQEVTMLFGTLLRALGFHVREINVMCWMYPFNSVNDFLIVEAYQDASSEVWVNGRWEYYGLYRTAPPPEGRPFRNMREWYFKKWPRFDVYEGIRQYRPDDNSLSTRFNAGSGLPYAASLNWEATGVWRLREQNIRNDKTADSTIYAPREVYGARRAARARLNQLNVRVYSPVAIELELPDGRRLGVREAPKGDPRAWLMEQGAPGLVHAIPDSAYVPAGLQHYTPGGVVRAPQGVRIQLPEGLTRKDIKMRLTGTGTGPYRVELDHATADGMQRFVPIQGTATKGKVETSTLGIFEPLGAREPWPEPPSRDSPRPAPPASQKQPADTAYLGVSAHAIDAVGAELFKVARGQGVILSHVYTGSAADRAGLRIYDVLTSIDGTPLKSMSDLSKAIGGMKPGQRTRIQILGRDAITVRLGSSRDGSDDSDLAQEVRFGQGKSLFDAGSRRLAVAGYRVTSLAGSDNHWMFTHTRIDPGRLQAIDFRPTLAQSVERAKRYAESGWELANVEFDGAMWSFVFQKRAARRVQEIAWSTDRREFVREITAMRKRGYHLTDLAQGAGVWVGVFTQGANAPAQSIVSVKTTAESVTEIRAKWKAGWAITHGARRAGEWLLSFEKRSVKQAWTRGDEKKIRTELVRRWKEGYVAHVLCAQRGSWFVVFERVGSPK